MSYIRFTEDAFCMNPKAELPMKKPGRENEGRRDQEVSMSREKGIEALNTAQDRTKLLSVDSHMATHQQGCITPSARACLQTAG